MNVIGMLPLSGIPEIVILPFFVAWVWAIVNCLRDSRKTGYEKAIWMVALILLNFATAALYWIVKLVSKKSSNHVLQSTEASSAD